MATTNISTIAVKFVADTNGLKKGSNEAGGFLNKLSPGTKYLTSQIGPLNGLLGQLDAGMAALGPAGLVAAGGILAIGAASAVAYKTVSVLFDQFLASSDRIDKMSKLATRLDLTYFSIQRLSFIAGRSGIEIDALAKMIEKMARTMGSGGMSLEARFEQQAKRIAAIKDPAKRAAEAFEVFGKEAGAAIPLLKNLGEDAERFARFDKSFNFGIGEADSKNVERMNDAWGDLVFIGTQLADKFVSKFGGPTAAFLEHILELTEDWAAALGDAGITWEDVGGFAIQFMKEISGLFTLLNGQIKIQVGFLEQVYAAHKQIAAFLSGDEQGKKDAAKLGAAGRKLVMSGVMDTSDFLTGKTARKFDDAIVNGTDFSKRGSFGSSSNGGFPAALELGSSGAASAILRQGGNPLEATAENTKQMLTFIQALLVETRKGKEFPVVLAAASL